ncbi:MAG: aminodeoxychorismate synthase component I [Sediminibacterium sp. Gen4]|uniref:aminodeoxychorismate synthase component I n=1 Tax=unclassified Sediminibacterium TaxID=2635961 RepID=UPI0015C11F3F|nr:MULTISPECIES: aminodeoxychorismate synthase component I [unclassified Sediminibacterium]MBW0161011.1 aminodeoxychorismate synthase component I [Sediminibacterium sp.]MBW0165610.1 aminodeoxychorismate synthase component I [Sediminibacterium sp.]NWK64941.1 aminodeoxychorismate synthase component I [Sediminibacterium sp. Gen4]
MLNWANQFNICCFLDNHQYQSSASVVECMVACGVTAALPSNASLSTLDTFINTHKNKWIFGHLGYDIKNQIENLHSTHPDSIQFPDLFFFVPACILSLKEQTLFIEVYDGSDPSSIYDSIKASPAFASIPQPSVSVQPKMTRQKYIATIEQLRKHIQRGDCYEINYCQEFYATDTVIEPLSLYQQLTKVSPNPFACYYRLEDKYLLCASPERFLQKKGDHLLSQPIKGTIPRNQFDPEADQKLIEQLQNSEKDKSENVMVVDLVRNDLSKVCQQGSVKVTELFGIYSFPQVHQMISTVEGTLDDSHQFTDIIKACFPMGSMTGAPKKRVMELIEQYEQSKRGLYSGAVGYISPTGDFDFNVVIRSILYNSSNQYLGYQVGGGITFYSDPEKEYEECLIKAAAIKKVLEGGI